MNQKQLKQKIKETKEELKKLQERLEELSKNRWYNLPVGTIIRPKGSLNKTAVVLDEKMFYSVDVKYVFNGKILVFIGSYLEVQQVKGLIDFFDEFQIIERGWE